MAIYERRCVGSNTRNTNRETTASAVSFISAILSCAMSCANVDLGQQLAVCIDSINKGKAAESQLASCFRTISYQSA